MKSVILVYKSNTGFTKRYAQWISKELGCRTIELKDAQISEVIQYDIIIYGGGMHANRVNGIKFIKNNLERFQHNHLVVFATGATPASAVEVVKQFEQANIPQGSDIPFFYFQSGMNYKDMRMNDKAIMNCLKFVLSLKKDKNSVEKGTKEAISSSYDHSEQAMIKPLIHHIRQLLT